MDHENDLNDMQLPADMTKNLPGVQQKGYLPALPEKPTEALLAIIQGVSTSPDVNTDVIEKLWTMQQQAEDRDAEQDYWTAMARMQPDLPIIPKNGRGHHDVPYAKFEDAIELIRPIMKKYGFSLTFKHTTLENGVIRTTGICAHKKGHKETDQFDSPPDTSGSKNPIQSVGSARSYGKRYTTGSLLGLAFGGEDDDGAGQDPADSGPPRQTATSTGASKKPASAGQINFMAGLLDKHGKDMEELRKKYNVKVLDDLKMDQVNEVIDWIKA